MINKSILCKNWCACLLVLRLTPPCPASFPGGLEKTPPPKVKVSTAPLVSGVRNIPLRRKDTESSSSYNRVFSCNFVLFVPPSARAVQETGEGREERGLTAHCSLMAGWGSRVDFALPWSCSILHTSWEIFSLESGQQKCLVLLPLWPSKRALVARLSSKR